MAHYCCVLLVKHKIDKTHKKTTKTENKKKGGILPSSSRFALSLLVATSTLLFQTLSPNIFFFSSKRKEKKTIKKKRNVEKGRSFPSSSHFTLSIFAFICARLGQTFSLSIFFFSSNRK